MWQARNSTVLTTHSWRRTNPNKSLPPEIFPTRQCFATTVSLFPPRQRLLPYVIPPCFQVEPPTKDIPCWCDTPSEAGNSPAGMTQTDLTANLGIHKWSNPVTDILGLDQHIANFKTSSNER